MIYRVLADAVVAVHFSFILFVVLGGLLALRWRRAAWLHLPAAGWAVVLEFRGWICPLTPLENALRGQAGEVGYAGGFIEHYLLPIVYPAGLTPRVQVVLAALVLLVNAVIYAFVWRSRTR